MVASGLRMGNGTSSIVSHPGIASSSGIGFWLVGSIVMMRLDRNPVLLSGALTAMKSEFLRVLSVVDVWGR